MKYYLMFIGLFFICLNSQAQKYKLEKGVVDFYSYAPLEDIEAKNEYPIGIIDTKNNTFSFRVKVKDFEFDSELMEEHFNENYMETEKFPTSTFKGSIEGSYNLKKEGDYNVVAKGELTVHGVSKNVTIPANLKVSKKSIALHSEFLIKLKDHDIEIPEIVFQKIAEEVKVTITSNLVSL